MKTFKDQMGREWVVKVDCDGLRRVIDARGVNLADEREAFENLERVRLDGLFVAEAAFELIRPQAEKQGITVNAFREAMWGDCIAAAGNAIMEGLTDFFQRPATRQAARNYIAAAAGKNGNPNPSGGLSADLPESSALTPAH